MTPPSPLVSGPDRPRESKKRRKRKSRVHSQTLPRPHPQAHWRSEAQHRAYSSKLLQALAKPPLRLRGGGAVRDAADRALASAARGTTRWSRAILTSRRRLRVNLRKPHNGWSPAVGTGRSPRNPKMSLLRLKGRPLPSMQRKVRVLGRLVPGCRKEPLPVILEEASDYIAALEMQVRAMTALAQLLSGGRADGPPQPPLL